MERKTTTERPARGTGRGSRETGDGVLLARVTALREQVRREGAARLAGWRPGIRRQEFLASAENLASYLALRANDLGELQTALSERGLSSLGRCEAHVPASLDAVAAALSCIAGRYGAAFPPAGWRDRGRELLARQAEAIFGRDPTGPRSRIMVTLGADAATDPALVHDMIAAGADCARINCAHDDAGIWRAMVAHVRAASRRLDRDCRVLMDLGGPKVRIAAVLGPGEARVHRGDLIALQSDGAVVAGKSLVTLVASEAEPLRRLARGHRVWIDDGKVGCVVEGRSGGMARLRVEQVRPKGVRMKAGKGLNFPDLDLEIPPLTGKDLGDLDFVVAHADIVGFSFVQRPGDIAWLQEELERRLEGRPLPPLMIKVETRLGVANLPELVVAAAGRQPTAVMIARGDLAVELGLQQLSETQEQLLWLCEAAHVPVVWATQVLDSLLKTGIPSRAEATDAAMAQRAECIMLNKGPHAVEAVRFLDNVLHRMDRHVTKKSPVLGALSQWTKPGRERPVRAGRRAKAD